MFPPTPAGGSIAALCCLQTAHEAEEEVAEGKRVPVSCCSPRAWKPSSHAWPLHVSSWLRRWVFSHLCEFSDITPRWLLHIYLSEKQKFRLAAGNKHSNKTQTCDRKPNRSRTPAHVTMTSSAVFGLKCVCLGWKMLRFDVFQTDFWRRTKGAMADQQEKVNQTAKHQTTKGQTWSSKRLLPLSASTPAVVSVLRVSAGLRWWWC